MKYARLAVLWVCAVGSTLLAETNDYWTPGYAPLDDRGKMKRLNEIEPRTMIEKLPANIDQSGSYYLIRNLTAASNVTNGIVIAADDVTLDLAGFVLTGTSNCSFGVTLDNSTHRNITIRNGVARGWGQGGFHLQDGINCRLYGVTAIDNGSGPAYAAITVGEDWDVEDCAASGNQNTGFAIGKNSRARNCKSRDNMSYGFMTGDGGWLENCSAVRNARDGFSGGMMTMILNCSASANTNNGIVVGLYSIASGNISGGNGQDGIVVGTGSRAERNLAANNGGRGISASAMSRVTENQAIGNTGSGVYGVWACRIDNNHLFGNAVGVESASYANGSLFVGNTAVGNTTNYIVTPTANFGEIVGVDRLTPNTNFVYSNPWANFSLQH